MGLRRRKENGTNGATIATPKTEDTYGLTGPIEMDNHKHFSSQDLARFELAQCKLQIHSQAIQIAKLVIEKTKRDAQDYVNKLNGSIAKTVSESRQDEESLKKLQNEIEEVYQIDLKTVSYDDKTGRINQLV